jgi:hypothetical protein
MAREKFFQRSLSVEVGLDDPEVRKLAANYGDPDEILKEDWIAPIPGITTPGSYEEYARNPGRWIYGAKA